jgi:hypothetical protein
MSLHQYFVLGISDLHVINLLNFICFYHSKKQWIKHIARPCDCIVMESVIDLEFGAQDLNVIPPLLWDLNCLLNVNESGLRDEVTSNEYDKSVEAVIQMILLDSDTQAPFVMLTEAELHKVGVDHA